MKFWKSKTFAVGVIIVCSALLIGLSWMSRQQERRRLAQLRALQQQAAPYEQEIREIQSELDKREKAISTNTDIAGAIPCFRISSAKDIEVVKELSAGHLVYAPERQHSERLVPEARNAGDGRQRHFV